ncbi:acylphosphatases [Longilinea arvoryzae]|uniref:Acylphosphatase n=1 Tax=Longilinea arvoryzae TaxID=360412 RepID=A0A0S7BIY8_9CHLR|nr:acylphosphatase [Longilinea arvoryzae]GAP15076.1 acylphosphatases [Longilinea arvoryzae]
MSNEEFVQLHAVVDGHVQGVGFRFYVKREAEELNLTGWVRNKYDGRVEVLAEGPRSDLEFFLSRLQRGSGPAYVSEVKVDWNPASEVYKRFNIAPSE